MAGQEVIHSGILAQGAVQALVEPLKSTNMQVLVNTMQCLVVLTCDSEARMQVGVYVSNNILFSLFGEVFDSLLTH